MFVGKGREGKEGKGGRWVCGSLLDFWVNEVSLFSHIRGFLLIGNWIRDLFGKWG